MSMDYFKSKHALVDTYIKIELKIIKIVNRGDDVPEEILSILQKGCSFFYVKKVDQRMLSIHCRKPIEGYPQKS